MRWLAALLLLTAAGCYDGEQDLLLLEEKFEDEAAVRAAWSSNLELFLEETIHPAEHALMVEDTLVIRHALGKQIFDDFSDGLWLEYSSNCADGPEMWLEQQPDQSFLVVVGAGTTQTSSFERWYTSVPPTGFEPATLSAIEMRFDGPGLCQIDNLRLYQPANITGF